MFKQSVRKQTVKVRVFKGKAGVLLWVSHSAVRGFYWAITFYKLKIQNLFQNLYQHIFMKHLMTPYKTWNWLFLFSCQHQYQKILWPQLEKKVICVSDRQHSGIMCWERVVEHTWVTLLPQCQQAEAKCAGLFSADWLFDFFVCWELIPRVVGFWPIRIKIWSQLVNNSTVTICKQCKMCLCSGCILSITNYKTVLTCRFKIKFLNHPNWK